MPLDIRNFFAAKKDSAASAKAKSSSSSSGGAGKDKKRKSSSSKAASSAGKTSTPRKSGKSATARKAVLSPIDEEGPVTVRGGKRKNNKVIIDDSDTDATTDGEVARDETNQQKKGPKSKKTTTNDSDDEMTDGEKDDVVEASSSSHFKNKKKAASDRNRSKNLKETTPEEFFASSNKRTSPRKSKPKGSYVFDDDYNEDHETGDLKEQHASPKRKKTPDDLDDSDDEVEIVKKSSSNINKRPSPKAAKTPPSKPVRKPSPFKKQKVENGEDKDEAIAIDNEGDVLEEDSKPKETPARGRNKRVGGASDKKSPSAEETEETPPSSKKRKTSTTTGSSRKKATPAKQEPLLEPTLELNDFDVDKAVPECMAGLTFVFTGELEDTSRGDVTDFVKMLGGRVTTSVSGRTSYLVVGEVLEDGRPYDQGKKFQAAEALDTVKIVMGVKKLYGLAKLYSDKAEARRPDEGKCVEEQPEKSSSASAPPAAASGSHGEPAKKPAVANPYARKAGAVANPYAKKKTAAANPYAKAGNASAQTQENEIASKKAGVGTNDLWVDKYAPSSTRDILGNKDCVTKLTTWLAKWESRFNNPKAVGKAFSSPQGPWKAALLSGPPGIGKTTTATLVAMEAGRDLLEFNASDVRSKKVMHESFGDITGSKSVEGFFQSKSKPPGAKGKQGQSKKRCIIMDEVDGMGGGDRGGMAELIQMIKNSRVPIICICNDRQSQKMKSLLPYCFDLRFRRPVKSQIAKAAIKVAEIEGLAVQPNAAEQMAESCGNDIRQVINCLQMWASDNRGKRSNALTYKGLKEREKAINKDEILRVSLFDASRLILEGRKGLNQADADTERSSFFKRNDAFFVDYSFTGLIVQQNYLKVMNPQFMEVKRKNDAHQALDFLERVHSAADSMSDYALVENRIRGGSDMNWSLLPFSAVLAVKTGFHAAGPTGAGFPGFPEFTTWLGRNSSRGKKQRVLQELNHHMNYRVSGGTQEVRLSYLPFLRQRFLQQLKDAEEGKGNTVAIELMDEYGLDRDDVFENLDEFKMDPKAPKIGDIDSKTKSAFTRAYNQGSHKSQALVEEQGAPKKSKRNGASTIADPEDPDAINDDAGEEEVDAEEDLEKIKAAFQKKRKGGATKAKSGAAKAPKGRGTKK